MGYRIENQVICSRTDGLPLDVLRVIPDGECIGVVQLHHGVSEYKERYLPFMKELAVRGYAAVIHDCRGHGKSVRQKEDLGYFYRAGVKGMVEDAHQITAALKEEWPNLPFVLFGHSMGTLVVRTYLQSYDEEPDLVILTGAPYKNSLAGMGILLAKILKGLWGEKHRSKFLEAITFGPFMKKFAKEKSPYAWCCSEPRVVEAYDTSELCGFTLTLEGFETLYRLMRECYNRSGYQCKNPQLPILLLGGSEDPCIGGTRKYAQTVQFLRRAGYKETRGKLYPGMRHEILNETKKQQVYRDIGRYMKKCLKNEKSM